jgi:mRNA interferase MazF
MRSGTRFEQGEVVFVPFPFTDLSSTKHRPALVLSNAVYNSSSPDIVVCGMTSNISNSAHSVLVQSKDMESGGLPVPSRIKVDKIFAIHKTAVEKRLGRVKAAVLAQAMTEFEALFQ